MVEQDYKKDQSILKWFRHMKNIDEGRITKVYTEEIYIKGGID